jgi:hypothetical protein
MLGSSSRVQESESRGWLTRDCPTCKVTKHLLVRHVVTASGHGEEACAWCLFARAEFHIRTCGFISWRFQQGPERANPAQFCEDPRPGGQQTPAEVGGLCHFYFHQTFR